MSLWRVLPASARRRMPWRNGRGSTLELCSDAPADDASAWTWRLSIADVPEAGPFSRFEGVDRWIACVDGRGMRVRVDGQWHRVPDSGRALPFAGESLTEGEPDGGGVRDANLMVARRSWVGAFEVARVAPGAVLTLHAVAQDAPATLTIVHALDAGVEISVVDRSVRVEKDETGIAAGLAPAGSPLQVRGDGGRVLAAFLRPKAAD